MATNILPLVAGNWKMNGRVASRAELVKIIAGAGPLTGKADLMVCPPATLIASFSSTAQGSGVAIGGQDCHPELWGAHTGDISAEMLADAGASAVIVGHSERRIEHHETDAQVRAKTEAAWRAGLTATPVAPTRRQISQDARRGRASALGVPAGRRNCREAGDRLRACVGNWNRSDAEAGGCRRSSRFPPQAAERALWLGRPARPHPLRWLGQAGKCDGALDGSRGQRGPGGRRLPQG